jgi:hypothetical protein
MVDAKGNSGPSAGSAPGILEDALGGLQKPILIAGAAAAIGLIAGIFIGRASVDRGAAEGEVPKVAQVQEELSIRAPKVAERVIPPEPPSSYRLSFGRSLPKALDGFERNRDGRPSARLTGKVATIPVEFDVKPGAYAITSVLSLEGSKKGALQLQLDGHTLGAFALAEGWQIYTIPVPTELLTKGPHELTLHPGGASERAVVDIDGIAVVPVGGEVSLDMGTDSAGSLIDGFGRPAPTHVWNDGELSTLGVMLTPVSGRDYQLTVRASTLPQLDPLDVTSKVNGTSVGTAIVGKHANDVTWSVPASALRAGLNRVEFSYPATLKPSELKPTSKDDRPLAVRFNKLTLRPAP